MLEYRANGTASQLGEFQRYHAATPEGDDTVRFETYGDGELFYRPDR